MSRWEKLPLSQQLQQELLNQAASSEQIPTVQADLAAGHAHIVGSSHVLALQLGELVQQEFIESSNQVLCHYHNLTSKLNNLPIAILCELGCCEEGCCGIEEYSQQSTINYGWALVLLLIFLGCVLVFAVVMFVLYVCNKKRDLKFKHQLEDFQNGAMTASSEGGDITNSAYSPSTVSQLSSRHQIYRLHNNSNTLKPTGILPVYHQYGNGLNNQNYFKSSF
uniref:Uncharacterized protein n=1 Tax=Ditylenchus dipsaci TaxID=166011 RepID=A0A915EI68_9BILA